MNENLRTLRERDGELVENWYIACLSRELGRDHPVSSTIYDTPLVLIRDDKNQVRCYIDRCLHRHALLSEGKIIQGKLACPYHGWVYDQDGKVIEVPSEGPGGHCKERGLKLKSFPAIEQDGCVWVWMGVGAPKTEKPPFRFPYLQDSQWVSYFMITEFENEVTHLVENFMDVPHTVFVHAGWFRNRTRKEVPIRVETKDSSVLVTYEQPKDTIGFTSKVLNPKKEPMVHTDFFIMPNITRVDYHFGSRNTFIIISQCTPVGKLKSRVYTAIIYNIGLLSRALKPFFRFYTRRVIEQDVVIMANQGASFRRDMTLNFHGTDADVVHSAIEKLRAMGTKNDPQLSLVNETVEKQIWI